MEQNKSSYQLRREAVRELAEKDEISIEKARKVEVELWKEFTRKYERP